MEEYIISCCSAADLSKEHFEERNIHYMAFKFTLDKLSGKIKIYNIGTTIGSHSGPGTVAVFFWGQDRGKLLLNRDI